MNLRRITVSGILVASLLVPLPASAIITSVPRPSKLRVPSDDSKAKNDFYDKQYKKAKEKHSSSSSASAQFVTYNARLGLTLSYMRSWELQDNTKWLTLLGKPKKLVEVTRGQQVPFFPTIFISTKRVPADPTPQQTASERIDNFFMQTVTLRDTELGVDYYMPSFHLDSMEDTTLLGAPARRYKFTGERSSKAIRAEAYGVIVDDIYFAVMLQSDPSFFDDAIEDFAFVVKSLGLTSGDAVSSLKKTPAKSSKAASYRLKKSSKSSAKSVRSSRKSIRPLAK